MAERVIRHLLILDGGGGGGGVNFLAILK